MSSGVAFESSRVKSKQREELREAREYILAKVRIDGVRFRFPADLRVTVQLTKPRKTSTSLTVHLDLTI